MQIVHRNTGRIAQCHQRQPLAGTMPRDEFVTQYKSNIVGHSSLGLGIVDLADQAKDTKGFTS